MTQFSEVAIQVVKKFQCTNFRLDPTTEWDAIANKIIQSQSSIEKGCPKDAFLGLCDAGSVIGIPSGNYTKSIENKRYAIQAVVLLRKDPSLSSSSGQLLWEKVMSSLNLNTTKAHNGQMNIVLDLWNHGYIR